MQKHKFFILSRLLLALTFVSLWTGFACADIKKITKEELKPLLGNSDLVIVDTRTGKDWQATEKKIQGAVREDPREVETWASKYDKNKQVVLYCA